MRKILSVITIGILCFSVLSAIAPQVHAATAFSWRDDFNYNTLGEMTSAGWTLAGEHLISVGDGTVTLTNDGVTGPGISKVGEFPAGIYDFVVETSAKRTDSTYCGIGIDVITEKHVYSAGADGATNDYRLIREGPLLLHSVPGYTPLLNVWENVRLERSGNTFRLYIDGELKLLYEEIDDTPSPVTGIGVHSGWLATIKYDFISASDYASTPGSVSAQYSSFVSAHNNYKKIFGQDVAIGQTVERTLSGIINDPPAHYQWLGYGDVGVDGFSVRIEAIQPDFVYKIIGWGHMAGSQPSASGWVQVDSPFAIEQVNYVENVTHNDGSYVRVYTNTETGRITFSAKWYNWPAAIDAPAFKFAVTIAKPGGILPPFSYDTTRTQAAYAYDTNARHVVMFGGFTHWTRNLNPDIWTLDPATSDWTFVSAGSGPAGRCATAMSYNPVQDNLLIFGGATSSGDASDTWKFHFTSSDTGTWTNVPGTGPSARVGTSMIYDQASNLFVLFGGERYVYTLGDTWTFDPTSNTWINKNPSPAPPQRTRFRMAFDMYTGKTLLFGGLNKGSGSLLGDTWLYDVATNGWQQVTTPTAPSARLLPSLASNGNGIFYLFGGWRVDSGGGLGQYLDDTWRFDTATMQWTQLFPSQSPIAQSQGALMHIENGRFVLINGWRDSPLGEVWYYDANQNTWTTQIILNLPPVADFEFERVHTVGTYDIEDKIYVGSEVKFDAAPSYDLDGPDQKPVSYDWVFGDGWTAHSHGELILHTYQISGPYTITLTVTDEKGATGQISKDIFIHPFEWALFVEIDYMAGHEPTDSVLNYIEEFYRRNGINLVIHKDDEVADPTPEDGKITENDFWQIENLWNDVWWEDDRALGNPNNAKYYLKEKWVLYGTVIGFPGKEGAYGQTLVPLNWHGALELGISDVAGNYMLIPDEYNDNEVDLLKQGGNDITKEESETMVLMHELGHGIGILNLVWDWGQLKYREEYGQRPAWSVMGDWLAWAVSKQRNLPRYAPNDWKLRDMEYYTI